MDTDYVSDICVVGGGPAGSTIARCLATFGYDVCLLESQGCLRAQRVATLSSAVFPLLETIGVRECVERAGFAQSEGMFVWWESSQPVLRHAAGESGLHVDRSRFDAILLENATAAGVRVLQPAIAMASKRVNGLWHIEFRLGREVKILRSKILVDASGGRFRLGNGRIRISPPLVALCGIWRNCGIADMHTRIEAGEREWYWQAPLAPHRRIAGVFLDPKRLRERGKESIEALYLRLLSGRGCFRGALSGDLEGAVGACDASNRRAEDSVGADYVKVGDAAFSSDPMSSQGVQLAIASGIQAAATVNTLLRLPENTSIAMAFYKERISERVAQFTGKTALIYERRARDCTEEFWHERARGSGESIAYDFERKALEPNSPLRVSSRVEFELTPVLRNDLVVALEAVRHKDMARAIAFVNGIELAPLLKQLRDGEIAASVVKQWSDSQAESQSIEILHWLWKLRIVVPADGAGAGLMIGKVR